MSKLTVYLSCECGDYAISASRYSDALGSEEYVYVVNTVTWEEKTIPVDHLDLFSVFYETVKEYEAITGCVVLGNGR